MNGGKLLLHCCCAPCSTSVTEYLINSKNCRQDEYKRRYSPSDITLYFYNPNIYPRAEYERRLAELYRFVKVAYGTGIAVIAGEYDRDAFTLAVAGYEDTPEGGSRDCGERCFRCMQHRIARTADVAAAGKYTAFDTTLSVSPHKDTAAIHRILTAESERVGSSVTPLCGTYRKKGGYTRSVELSREYGLYRQEYCGCRPPT